MRKSRHACNGSGGIHSRRRKNSEGHMEPEMGKVIVSARLENLDDVSANQKGQLPAEQIRSVSVSDALVDTGATGLFIPSRMVKILDLLPLRTRTAKTIAGNIQVNTYRAV